jgi:molecular chaperone GrpE
MEQQKTDFLSAIIELIEENPNDMTLGSKIRQLYWEAEDDGSEDSEKQIWSKDEVDLIKSELNDKYLRLYADFENFKKRTQKEKEEIRTSTKISTLHAILDMDNDLSIASNKIDKEGIELIMNKLDSFLKSHGVETVQTESYDPDIHEVISIMETGEEKIIDVVSKGYSINGKIVRYPKVILSK